MRDLRKEILGFVLTVISHEPRRYFVLAEEVNSDPLEMVRWVYSFNHGHDPNIIAKVTSRLIDARFHERENQMHYETIRFALRKIREYPEVTEFLFTSNDMESTNEVSVIKGLDLRYQILRFFYDVYAGGLPQQGISVYDLCYNFPNDMQDMQGWVTDLDQAGFLIRTRTDQKYVTTDNRTTSSQAHKINPQRLADIQAELRKWQSEQGMTIETRRLDMEQQYDVALSYASENGKYVRSVADSLKAHSVSVFYDEYEKIP
ncbi:MAG: toll/interleukin-1 receptor domain-containing protein, partial [candidate division Zixibacteria bacterium]|nr:toll/interleukin-1 receptor domain-containing protein [candidate division Zixibacteria bacterium]